MTVVFLLIGVVLMPMFWVLRLFKRDVEHAQQHQPYQQFLQGKMQHQPLHPQHPSKNSRGEKAQ